MLPSPGGQAVGRVELGQPLPSHPPPPPRSPHLVLMENNHAKAAQNSNFELAEQRVVHPAVTPGDLEERQLLISVQTSVHTPLLAGTGERGLGGGE